MKCKRGAAILCVGNFDSGTGYAWNLIEHLWTNVAIVGNKVELKTIACYPSISEVNPVLNEAQILIHKHYFATGGFFDCFKSLVFIRNNNIQCLYLTDRPVFSWCYLLYRFAGITKIVVHDHTPGYRPPVVGLKKFIKTIMNRLPWVSVDIVIGVSNYVCERLEIVNRVPKNKIICVTNGLSDSCKIKDYSFIQSEVVRIVTVARVNHYKGVDFAIRVIKKLVTEYNLTNIQYDVIGDGPDLDEFKMLAESLGVIDFVNFQGKRSNVEDLLPAYDIAFHPSKGEAMCLAIVEYMRAALPVIVSSNPSVNSILSENIDSLFYQEGSVESAASKVRDLAQTPAIREKLGMTGRARFEENYISSIMDQSFKSCIYSLLNE